MHRTGTAFPLYNAGLRAIGGTASSLILLVEIVFGMLFASTLRIEAPTPATG